MPIAPACASSLWMYGPVVEVWSIAVIHCRNRHIFDIHQHSRTTPLLLLLLLLLSLCASPVSAQGELALGPLPPSINVCTQTAISWRGGTPPYTLNVLPESSSSTPAGNETIHGIKVQTYDWIADLAPGTKVKLSVTDSTGASVSDDLSVSNNTLSSCVGREVNADASYGVALATLTDQPHTHRLSTAAIVGIAIGTIATAGLLGAVLWYVLRERGDKQRIRPPQRPIVDLNASPLGAHPRSTWMRDVEAGFAPPMDRGAPPSDPEKRPAQNPQGHPFFNALTISPHSPPATEKPFEAAKPSSPGGRSSGESSRPSSYRSSRGHWQMVYPAPPVPALPTSPPASAQDKSLPSPPDERARKGMRDVAAAPPATLQAALLKAEKGRRKQAQDGGLRLVGGPRTPSVGSEDGVDGKRQTLPPPYAPYPHERF
ncbi:uncharacterized protein BXZ73DRAFT_76999 [Epithele typhae]|uniref:uncharacterized protein n=1 Tax=Epithele typhae TaxID=378194 RepID=UPI0020072D6D|nr:uncharacterized protein BXZ73DRAFT_76999 [Epithele typhae]KAH9934516.1 hypothetical protein BXZ73DRAFT_76999 [Epithele typhae]